MSKRHPHYDPKVIQARAHEALQADANLAEGKQANANQDATKQDSTNGSQSPMTANNCFWAAGVVFVGGVALAFTGNKKSGGLLLTLGVPALLGYGVYQLLAKKSEETLTTADNTVVN